MRTIQEKPCERQMTSPEGYPMGAQPVIHYGLTNKAGVERSVHLAERALPLTRSVAKLALRSFVVVEDALTNFIYRDPSHEDDSTVE